MENESTRSVPGRRRRKRKRLRVARMLRRFEAGIGPPPWWLRPAAKPCTPPVYHNKLESDTTVVAPELVQNPTALIMSEDPSPSGEHLVPALEARFSPVDGVAGQTVPYDSLDETIVKVFDMEGLEYNEVTYVNIASALNPSGTSNASLTLVNSDSASIGGSMAESVKANVFNDSQCLNTDINQAGESSAVDKAFRLETEMSGTLGLQNRSDNGQHNSVNDRFREGESLVDKVGNPLGQGPVNEFIDLVNDDESEELFDKAAKKRRNPMAANCINVNCDSGEDLTKPTLFVLSYYGLKRLKQQQVCAQCYQKAVVHQEELAGLLVNHRSVLEADFPNYDTVVMLDSDDEEDRDMGEVLSPESRRVVEEHLYDTIQETAIDYDLDFQIEHAVSSLRQRLQNVQRVFEEHNAAYKVIEKSQDAIRRNIYGAFKQRITELPPIDLSDLEDDIEYQQVSPTDSDRSGSVILTEGASQVSPQQGQFAESPWSSSQEVVALETEVVYQPPPLPPVGPLVRLHLNPGDAVYMMRVSFFSDWIRATIVGTSPESAETYSVRADATSRKSATTAKNVLGKYLAYMEPSPVRLHVGVRVIAIFRDDESNTRQRFFSGIIAEPPKRMNSYRYMIFFDDGYAQYCHHENVRVVCQSSQNVWDDIHPDSRDFIKKYLNSFPERPMVKMQTGQVVKTEWNGKWWVARVMEVDGSLVKMHFDADSRTEWIYRGSTRLGPLFAEIKAATQRQKEPTSTFSRTRGLGIASLKKRNMPYVEYTRHDVEEKEEGDDVECLGSLGGAASGAPGGEAMPARSVARKSTATRSERQTVTTNVDQPKPFVEQVHPGFVEDELLEDVLVPREFQRHQCRPHCVQWTGYRPNRGRGYNPLSIPLRFGFQRLIGRFRGKRVVLYVGPCGRRLRTVHEMHLYLTLTKSELTIDLFDFEFWVHCLAEFRLERTFARIEDLSYKKENVPISCVNYLDHSLPDYVEYMTERQPSEGVNLNLDPGFLCGCDCEDDCVDKTRCACQQLTIKGTALNHGGRVDEHAGYHYRRLQERVLTGIYECNRQCRCSRTCLNRVAQHPLQLKLQLFKTAMKGWGIRCLNDVPQGSFICIYAGNLLTEQAANEGGKNYGDEYLAELDYIEVIEKLKENYESGVEDELEEDSDENEERDKHGEESSSGGGDSQDGSEAAARVLAAGAVPGGAGTRKQTNKDSDYEFRPAINHGYSRLGRSAMHNYDPNSIRSRLRNRTSRQDSDDGTPKEKSPCEDQKEIENKRGDNSRKESSSGSPICISDDELDEVRTPSRFTAEATKMDDEDDDDSPKHTSVREFYGAGESVYIMDAKCNGNIGRYLNHSCNPNVFVQNVFVDTHDLRFPWVAFFALSYIRAGTELTWDYNYDVGSVTGKVMHCYCGSGDCRGRLL